MAAKRPSAKATKAKQPVVKKVQAAKEKEPAAARKAAPARKAAASTRSKPAAAPAPRASAGKSPNVGSVHQSIEKPDRTEQSERIAASPAEEATVATPAPAEPELTATAEQPAKTAQEVSPAEADPELDQDTAQPTISARAVISDPMTNIQDADLGDSDDSDQDVSGLNLLSGPRNVKPYIPRRGEQYMSKEQLEHFRQILTNWKKDLMQEVDRTVLHMKDEAANFPDPNDRATQESEFSLELRTRDRERKLIRKIDEAIKRIEDGTYGYCVETGEEIGIKRLEARPVATLCVEAQERRERREKQYGDRDDRYR
jgi:DnaK suppressor protein